MGQLVKRELINLLILWIAFCAGIIYAEYAQRAVWLIFSSVCLGSFLSGLYISYKKDWNPTIDYVITVLFAVLGIIFVIFEPPFLRRLDHCYFNNNTVDFQSYIHKENEQNHKFIFAIDFSGGYLDLVKSRILKERLEYDLQKVLQENNETNDFIIFRIGKTQNYIPLKDSLRELVKENVFQEIEKIDKQPLENNISDFYNFYKSITAYCKDNNYTLYVYSDFIYDVTKETAKPNEQLTKELDDNSLKVKKWQKELAQNNVTQNLFYIPITKIENDERKILPEKDTAFINRFNVLSSNKQVLVPQQIEFIKNLPFFYFKDIEGTRASLQLNFKNNGNHVIDIDHRFKISDGNDSSPYFFNQDNPNSLNNKFVKINYDHSEEPNPFPRLKIVQGNKHYISTCHFEENRNSGWRFLYFLGGILLSSSICFAFNVKQKKK